MRLDVIDAGRVTMAESELIKPVVVPPFVGVRPRTPLGRTTQIHSPTAIAKRTPEPDWGALQRKRRPGRAQPREAQGRRVSREGRDPNDRRQPRPPPLRPPHLAPAPRPRRPPSARRPSPRPSVPPPPPRPPSRPRPRRPPPRCRRRRSSARPAGWSSPASTSAPTAASTCATTSRAWASVGGAARGGAGCGRTPWKRFSPQIRSTWHSTQYRARRLSWSKSNRTSISMPFPKRDLHLAMHVVHLGNLTLEGSVARHAEETEERYLNFECGIFFGLLILGWFRILFSLGFTGSSFLHFYACSSSQFWGLRSKGG